MPSLRHRHSSGSNMPHHIGRRPSPLSRPPTPAVDKHGSGKETQTTPIEAESNMMDTEPPQSPSQPSLKLPSQRPSHPPPIEFPQASSGSPQPETSASAGYQPAQHSPPAGFPQTSTAAGYQLPSSTSGHWPVPGLSYGPASPNTQPRVEEQDYYHGQQAFRPAPSAQYVPNAGSSLGPQAAYAAPSASPLGTAPPQPQLWPQNQAMASPPSGYTPGCSSSGLGPEAPPTSTPLLGSSVDGSQYHLLWGPGCAKSYPPFFPNKYRPISPVNHYESHRYHQAPLRPTHPRTFAADPYAGQSFDAAAQSQQPPQPQQFAPGAPQQPQLPQPFATSSPQQFASAVPQPSHHFTSSTPQQPPQPPQFQQRQPPALSAPKLPQPFTNLMPQQFSSHAPQPPSQYVLPTPQQPPQLQQPQQPQQPASFAPQLPQPFMTPMPQQSASPASQPPQPPRQNTSFTLQQPPQPPQFQQRQPPQPPTSSAPQSSHQFAPPAPPAPQQPHQTQPLAVSMPQQSGTYSLDEVTAFSNQLQTNVERHVDESAEQFVAQQQFSNFLLNLVQQLERSLDHVKGQMAGYQNQVYSYEGQMHMYNNEVRAYKDQVHSYEVEVAKMHADALKLTNRITEILQERDVYKEKWEALEAVQGELGMIKTWMDYHDNANTFSAVNFRALLDHFQGILALFTKLTSDDTPPTCPYQHCFPTDGALKDWRNEMQCIEDLKKTEKRNQFGKFCRWSNAEALQVRMERTRELIVESQDKDLLLLLQSEAVIKLLAEKQLFIRLWGNTHALRIAEQGGVLRDMVQTCVDFLEPYKVEALLALIHHLRPDPADAAPKTS